MVYALSTGTVKFSFAKSRDSSRGDLHWSTFDKERHAQDGGATFYKFKQCGGDTSYSFGEHTEGIYPHNCSRPWGQGLGWRGQVVKLNLILVHALILLVR